MAEPLLHGTATLALAVSEIVKSTLNSDPEKIRRIGCRFSKPVISTHRSKNRDVGDRRESDNVPGFVSERRCRSQRRIRRAQIAGF